MTDSFYNNNTKMDNLTKIALNHYQIILIEKCRETIKHPQNINSLDSFRELKNKLTEYLSDYDEIENKLKTNSQ